MAQREKVCKDCRRFIEGSVCPVCKKANFSRSWKGIVFINDPQGSEIAELLGIKVPGKYALWVK